MALPPKKVGKKDESKKSDLVTTDQVHGAVKALADKKNMDKNKKKKVAAKLKGMLPGKK